jgi:PhnB protein
MSEKEQTMQLNAYLSFNGNCEEAFKFYEKALGAKIEGMMTHAGSPMASQTPANWQNKIMHARLTVDGQVLMGSDVPPDKYQLPKGVSITLSTKKVEEAERIFQALSDNAKVEMPLQETFWAVRFGMLRDRFGIPWMINCEKAAMQAGQR